MVDVGIIGKPFIIDYRFVDGKHILRFNPFKNKTLEESMKDVTEKLKQQAFPPNIYILN